MHALVEQDPADGSVSRAQCYKHVCALLVRSLKRSPPAQRLNSVYILSAICRQSKMQLKGKDKYGARNGAKSTSPTSRALD